MRSLLLTLLIAQSTDILAMDVGQYESLLALVPKRLTMQEYTAEEAHECSYFKQEFTAHPSYQQLKNNPSPQNKRIIIRTLKAELNNRWWAHYKAGASYVVPAPLSALIACIGIATDIPQVVFFGVGCTCFSYCRIYKNWTAIGGIDKCIRKIGIAARALSQLKKNN